MQRSTKLTDDWEALTSRRRGCISVPGTTVTGSSSARWQLLSQIVGPEFGAEGNELLPAE